eukprot:4562398-Karenia_brevis.AAC.1
MDARNTLTIAPAPSSVIPAKNVVTKKRLRKQKSGSVDADEDEVPPPSTKLRKKAIKDKKNSGEREQPAHEPMYDQNKDHDDKPAPLQAMSMSKLQPLANELKM